MTTSYYQEKLHAHRLQRVYEIACPRVRQYLEAEINHLAKFVHPGDKILEVGCGYGRALAPLSEIAGQGWGVDNANDTLMLAKTRFPFLHLSLMDAADLEFPDRYFDLVFAIQNFVSICKVPPERLVQECLRVTRFGGRVLLSSYAAQFWPHRLKWFRRQADEGLLGHIDESATGNGVIVCTDGFKATTVNPDEFIALTRKMGVHADVYTIDDSSVFCEIQMKTEYYEFVKGKDKRSRSPMPSL